LDNGKQTAPNVVRITRKKAVRETTSDIKQLNPSIST